MFNIFSRSSIDGRGYVPFSTLAMYSSCRCIFKLSNGKIQFKYDQNNVRTHKHNGDNSSEYFYVGEKLVAEKRRLTNVDLYVGDELGSESGYTTVRESFITYLYGVEGITGFTIKQGDEMNQYYYRKNIQGDVTHIYDVNNNLAAEYTYDAWGNHICKSPDGIIVGSSSTGIVVGFGDHIGNINSIRYRGYYFDTETGLYYLKSRYYDSEVGRFINMDKIEVLDATKYQINGLNLFAYCLNNPVNMCDDTGMLGRRFWRRFFGWAAVAVMAVAAIAVSVVTFGAATPLAALAFGASVGALVGIGASIISQGGFASADPWQVFFNGVMGAAAGAAMASPLGWASTGAIVGGLGFAQSVGNDLFNNGGNFGQINWGRAATIGVISGVLGGAGKYISQSGRLMHVFTKNSKSVQRAAVLSKVLGNKTRLGAKAYQQFWNTAIRVQTSRIHLIANTVRGGAVFGTNRLWR